MRRSHPYANFWHQSGCDRLGDACATASVTCNCIRPKPCCRRSRQMQAGRTGSNGDVAGSPGGQQRGSPHKHRPEKPQAVAGPLLLAAAELIRQFPEVYCRLQGSRGLCWACARDNMQRMTGSEIQPVLPVLLCDLCPAQTSGALHVRNCGTASRRSSTVECSHAARPHSNPCA